MQMKNISNYGAQWKEKSLKLKAHGRNHVIMSTAQTHFGASSHHNTDNLEITIIPK